MSAVGHDLMICEHCRQSGLQGQSAALEGVILRFMYLPFVLETSLLSDHHFCT